MITAPHSHRRVLAVALSIAIAGFAQAMKIDDFEAEGFNLSTSTSQAVSLGPISPLHCVSNVRDVVLSSGGAVCTADLNLGMPDDEVAMVMGQQGGSFRCRYQVPVAMADLTGGGIFGAIRVRLTVAAPNGTLRLFLQDRAGGNGFQSLNITGAGKFDFQYSSFVGVDPGDIELIQLELITSLPGDYHLSDISLTKAGTSAANLTVTTGTLVGPPYPAGPIVILITVMNETGLPEDVGELFITLDNVTDMSGQPTPHEWTVADSGGAGGGGGEQVEGSAGTPLPSKTQLPHYHTWDGIRHNYVGTNGNTIDPAGNPLLTIHPPEPGAAGPTSFVLEQALVVRSDTGVARYGVRFSWGFEVAPNMGYSFTDIACIRDDSSGEAAFLLTFGMDAVAVKKATALEYGLIGLAEYTPSGSVSTDAFGASRLRLWAQPSLMANSTQLWLSRALPVGIDILVYDVAGRSVQAIAIDPSQQFTTWNGLDAHGRDIASGVYYLRAVQDGRPLASAKLVKVR